MELPAATKPTNANFVRVIRKNVQWIKVVTNDSIGTCSSELYIFHFWNFRHRLVRLYVMSTIPKYTKSYTRSSIVWLSSFGFSWGYLRNKDCIQKPQNISPINVQKWWLKLMYMLEFHGISIFLERENPHDLRSSGATMAPWNPRWRHLQCWRSEPRPWSPQVQATYARQLGSFFQVPRNLQQDPLNGPLNLSIYYL